jgi:hypothetical protein
MLRVGICTTVFLATALAYAEEKPLEVSLESLALFKNGLACIEYVAEIPEGGTYRVENMPDAVHGTFWVESDADVAVQTTRRRVEMTLAEASSAESQQDLAGREVVVRFKEPHLEPISGKVVSSQGIKTWSRNYEPSRYGWWPSVGMSRPGTFAGSLNSKSMLVLETSDGLTYLEASTIASLDIPGGIQSVSRERPVMLLHVPAEQQKPISVVIRSLTKGVAWAPSYQVDASDPASLVIRQKAVLKNELVPIRDADIRLISGFPSVRFANVTSPMSVETTWSQFFQQLSQQYSARSGGNRAVVSQTPVMSNFSPSQPGVDLSAIPSGEGADLHFQSIGRRTLDLGDSLTLQTATGEADYERIVEWIIPDTRDVYGNFNTSRNRDTDPEVAWDALRFRNPFDFPMTTAPAMIVANGRFLGQQVSHWTNVGEQMTLRVTKALSVRTHSSEHEVEGERSSYSYLGGTIRKTKMEGEVIANNHRNERITLVIRKRFSGKLLSAEGDPHKTLREEGVWSINPRNELIWTVKLTPGEEVRFAHTYTVLTFH